MAPRRAHQEGFELGYQPALDGLRALAVLVVLAYHGGVPGTGGGFVGVEAFFVLSGYLITSLLLARWHGDGTIRLRAFWARRARRLLPALCCLVVVTAIYETAVGPSGATPDFGADALSTLGYVANWHEIWTSNGYFAETALTSPLQHTWSLAIEEQFYLLWPLLLAVVLGVWSRSRPAPRRRLRLLAGVSALGALASAAEMALLYRPGDSASLSRVYYGTDTRAEGLLVGAALAAVVALRRQSATRRESSGRLGAVGGVVGLAAVVALGAMARSGSGWLYRGGFLAFDLAVVAVIVDATSADAPSLLRPVLASFPLRATGQISYGLYLWHFPLFLWLDQQATGLSGAPLFGLRVAVTFAVAVVSYFAVEQPIRRRRLSPGTLRLLAPAASLVVAVPVALSFGAGEAPTLTRPAAARAAVVPDATSGAATCSQRLPGARTAEVFHTCPVDRVLLVGDSIGLTLDIELALGERPYGVELWGKAISGCGFRTGGEVLDTSGDYVGRSGSCRGALALWRTDERRYRPAVVVVEMGYWDTVDMTEAGRPVHLGQPAFDRAVEARMARLVRLLASRRTPLVVLSVPLVDPPPLPDGAIAPQASPARNELINSMLAGLARRHPGEVHFFDLSPYVTPHGRFQAVVDGGICRSSDGVHFFDGDPGSLVFQETPCGARLGAALLPFLRRVAATRP